MQKSAMPIISIRPFAATDHAAARSLWERTEGVGLGPADEIDAIAAFLVRNPGLSFVAEDDGHIVGTILVGHDGRRGLIHHLAVAGSHRRRGVGRLLVDAGLEALGRTGIGKCHLFVFENNSDGQAFWEAIGAERRDGLGVYSLVL